MRQRDVERRQRIERERLEREKEKLRAEREKIEREKAELVRMERERQRLEREKLALEKMELERTLIRLDEERRAVKRPSSYRREDNFDDRKRSASDRHYNEPPPPPPRYYFKLISFSHLGKFCFHCFRINPPSGSSSKYESRPYDARDSRSNRGKEGRYNERERSPHFRSARPLPDTKPVMSESRGTLIFYFTENVVISL